MFTRCLIYLATICYVATEIDGQARVAVTQLVAGNVAGSIRFTETDEGLHVTGTITGPNPGKYGFHIHELGDISSCDATGMHFNPDGTNHGGPDHDQRHVGDLGNIEFVGDGVATVDFVDKYISLRGRNSVLGRALVLHAAEDDLGMGEDEASLVTGNAGARIACGVIGLLSPADPWNSATSVAPSATQLKLLITSLFYFRS